MEGFKELEPNLLGDSSKLEIDDKELNTAAALTALSMKLLDAVSNIYQIHGNVMRLGNNLDILVNQLNSYSRDFRGKIDELQMRLEDVEVLQLNENKRNGE